MHYDLIVIGSGQAGVPLAARMAEAGRRVLLAERKALGGTCVNYGCTPTKTMIASARAAYMARHAARLGVHAGEVTVDLAAIVERKDKVVHQWRAGVERRLARAGERLTLSRGHARFAGPREVEVGGERHTADVIVINVGTRPAVPPIEGLDTIRWLDNASVMELRGLPSHLVVLGGGYIGCEFAQMFRRFGSRVTIVNRGPRLLGREDAEVVASLEKVFQHEGIELVQDAKVESAGGGRDGLALRLEGGREIRGSHLLVATGRAPNTRDLGCDLAGIGLDEKGFIRADDHYCTTVPGVYAVGDVTGQPQFTHTAWDDHRILVELLLGRSKRGRAGRFIPYTVFTDPQVAGVGLSEREAVAQGMPYEVATMDFGHVARAIEVDEPAGAMKLLIDPNTEKILGVTIVGAEAGELIHIFVALMQAGASARAIVDAQFVHPTFAEGVQSLVMKLKRYALT